LQKKTFYGTLTKSSGKFSFSSLEYAKSKSKKEDLSKRLSGTLEIEPRKAKMKPTNDKNEVR